MKRNSQLYSQIFIYILAILLTSFILVYGYNAIKNFQIRAEQVACLKFQNELKSAVDSISSEYESVTRKDLQLCSGYKGVCFVDESPTTSPQFEYINYITNPTANDPIIIDSISSGANKNVFFVDNLAKESFYAGKISIDENIGNENIDVLCIKAVSNRISLKLEGKGDHTLLSEWTENE